MSFLDTNSYLTTKLSYFDIKCQSHSDSYDRHGFLGPSLRVVRFFFIISFWVSFTKRERESTLGLTGWTFSYVILGKIIFIKIFCILSRSLLYFKWKNHMNGMKYFCSSQDQVMKVKFLLEEKCVKVFTESNLVGENLPSL